jgi:hypothetical protein
MVMFIACNNAPEITYNQQTTTGPTYITTGTTNKHGDYAITFKNTSKRQKIRHISVSGTGYDDFQLFTMCDTGVVMNPYLVQYNGTGWAYAGVGTQDTVWFYSACEGYDFVGIIPSDATTTLNSANKTVSVTGVEAFVVKEAIEDSPKEFLYSKASLGKSDYANGVDLNFKHGNAKVYFNFESDDAATKLLNFVPTIPAVPASPGTPDTETYTKKTTRFIDELVAGSQVQVCIGFYGVSSPKLTENNPNPLYVGTNNTTNGWLAKDWLLSIKDAVNAQFVYYRLNQVNNSTSKVETTEDWESAASNKNIFMMELASGVNKADFAAGNDVFWNALVAHDAGTAEPWVGGTPAMPFKQMFAQAYADGWRVVRINVSDANANQVLVFLSSNIEASTQVCEITPGTPATPGTPEISGIDGFILLAATSNAGDGSDAVVSQFVSTADATVSFTSNATYTPVSTVDRFVYDIPATALTTKTQSPSVLFSLPVKSVATQGFTLKFSYVYKGDSVYDVRAYVPASKCVWEEGKYYTYNIKIQGLGNGKSDPTEADVNDPVVGGSNVIEVINVTVSDYTEGDSYDIIIKH